MLLERKGVEISEPRCDGLEGDTFWVVAQKGRQADDVRNIEANRLYESESAVSRARGGAHCPPRDHPTRRRPQIASRRVFL